MMELDKEINIATKRVVRLYWEINQGGMNKYAELHDAVEELDVLLRRQDRRIANSLNV